MKKLTLFLSLALAAFTAAAQFVTIPDPAFRAWLVQNHPSCMNANQEMDVNCVDTITNVNVTNKQISSLDGIQHFDRLKTLNCGYNNLTVLPALSDTLEVLVCYHNSLTSLPPLPDSLHNLMCEYNPLTSLPILPISLRHITCANTTISSLPTLPTSLEYLNCSSNQLTSLPTLPSSLLTLNCYGNQLTSLPTLPSSLLTLYCFSNQLTSLPALPNALADLDCKSNNLMNLPTLPNSLQNLKCGDNYLANLPALPNSLQNLECPDNSLVNLPALPNSLQTIYCVYNSLVNFPTLPNSLQYIHCYNNQLTSLPTLPNSLKELSCSHNQLTSLPTLPSSLTRLSCSHNQLTSLPTLPNSLKELSFSNNQLTSLPTLPNALERFSCSNNQLTSLPILPNSLQMLNCSDNSLNSLATLPNSLTELYCSNIQLNSLPTLPNSLIRLDCPNNSLNSLPTLPNSLLWLDCFNNSLNSLAALPSSLYHLSCNNNPITCFPLYNGTYVMADVSNTYISCVSSNVIQVNTSLPTCTSPSQICGASMIVGIAYIDNNANGIFDTGDQPIINQNIGANDGNGNTAWAMTDTIGNYAIFASPSTNPYIITNPVQNNYYLASPSTYNVLLNSAGMTSTNNDFILIPNGSHHDLEAHLVGGNSLGHRPGFDVGYDLYYQNQGTTTQNAQLVFTADAGITFVSSSVAPTNVNGNVYTWDFTNLAPFDHGQIQLVFNVPTTFVIGDSVNASLDISSVNVDETPSDNLQTTIYPIINGYDPNDKQVSKTELSPSEVAAGRELSYLIRFQNTGNAEAINVMIIDELSENLDIASLEILGSSHDMVPQLSGAGKLQFYFANIMLPDSNTNEPASHGYVAYRIKPKTDLVLGDQIDNTANIYFDYNPAIVTNTVTTTVVIPTSKDLAKVTNLSAYPVPVMNELNVEWAGEAQVTSIEISNLAGQIFSKQEINSTNTAKIDFSHFTQGVYLISLMNGAEKVGVQKVVK